MIDAKNKKEGKSQYLADLKQIRKAYVQDVKEISPINSISQNSEKSTSKTKKVSENDGNVTRRDLDEDFTTLANEHRRAAVERWGYTHDYKKASFILPDGNMLNFGNGNGKIGHPRRILTLTNKMSYCHNHLFTFL